MFKENLNDFLETEEFAVKVRCDNPARTFTAIFDDIGTVSNIGGVVVENANAKLTCAPASVQGFTWERTEVDVEGHGVFTVTRTGPDGTGLVVVELE